MLTYGKKLAIACQEKGWLYKEMANKVGLSRSYFSKILNDRVPPSLPIQRAINNALGYDLDGFVPPLNTKEAEEDCFARTKKDREQHNDFSQQIPESLLNDGSIKAESKPRQCPILYQWLLDTMLEIIDLWQPTDNIFEIYGRTVYEKVRKEAAAYANAANPLRDNG